MREAPPPEPKYAVRPVVTRQSPLAAKPNSVDVSGIPAFGSTVQVRPESLVDRIRNLPSTGVRRG